MRRIVLILVLIGCSFVRTAEAQIPVTDVANLIQAILISESEVFEVSGGERGLGSGPFTRPARALWPPRPPAPRS